MKITSLILITLFLTSTLTTSLTPLNSASSELNKYDTNNVPRQLWNMFMNWTQVGDVYQYVIHYNWTISDGRRLKNIIQVTFTVLNRTNDSVMFYCSYYNLLYNFSMWEANLTYYFSNWTYYLPLPFLVNGTFTDPASGVLRTYLVYYRDFRVINSTTYYLLFQLNMNYSDAIVNMTIQSYGSLVDGGIISELHINGTYNYTVITNPSLKQQTKLEYFNGYGKLVNLTHYEPEETEIDTGTNETQTDVGSSNETVTENNTSLIQNDTEVVNVTNNWFSGVLEKIILIGFGFVLAIPVMIYMRRKRVAN